MTDTLSGKQIVLAGGAGGLGLPLAKNLAAEGAQVVISSRTGRGNAIQADLAIADDRIRLLTAAPQLYGIVVLAGDPARIQDPSEIDAAMRLSHEANYFGPILLAREAAARMKATGTPGSIVLISTMQANFLFPGSTIYAAQKAALQHAALILAKECRGPANIRVNVVSPGIMDAGMAQASIAAGKYNRYLDDGTIPRFGRPEDVARAVRLLLEPDSYITGQVLCVDGGMTL